VPALIALFTLIAGLWLLLSGYFEPLLLSFGLLSCLVVIGFCMRLQLIGSGQGHVAFYTRLLGYFPWLLKEIVLSNIEVARHIWHPALPISPTMVRARASQKTDIGLAIHANSITLTPGTLSIDVDEHGIIVHGLSREVTEGVIDSEMNRRVAAIEGQH
jgi:multicomponent Na+:H+ antiporter subunit E